MAAPEGAVRLDEMQDEDRLVDYLDAVATDPDGAVAAEGEGEGEGEGVGAYDAHADANIIVAGDGAAGDGAAGDAAAAAAAVQQGGDAEEAKALEDAGLKSWNGFLLPVVLHCCVDIEVTGAMRATHQICQRWPRCRRSTVSSASTHASSPTTATARTLTG